jgi:hypothetical protein
MTTIELPSPSEMTPVARAAEVTSILAAAIVRTLVAPEATEGTVRLGFLPDQRVHATPSQQEQLS